MLEMNIFIRVNDSGSSGSTKHVHLSTPEALASGSSIQPINSSSGDEKPQDTVPRKFSHGIQVENNLSVNSRSICLGLHIPLPAYKDTCLIYPFAVHSLGVSWTPNINHDTGKLYICSHMCKGEALFVPCSECNELERSSLVK